jgi:oxygen-independent coproporphyrinogen-3 oxidase
MIRVKVFSPSTDQVRIVKEVLRIYFPRLKEIDTTNFLISSNYFSGTVKADKKINLYLEKQTSPLVIKVKLEMDDQVFFHEEVAKPPFFSEEETNRARRLLRLALQQIFSLAKIIKPSPWGILTGVRPLKIVQRFMDDGITPENILNHLIKDYALEERKAKLLLEIAYRQRPFLPKEKRNLVSLYLGIPFCPTRCYYCSFPAFSLDRWGYLLADYLQALEKEIIGLSQVLQEKEIKVQTVYLGGGTPTILSAGQLAKLLTVVQDNFAFVPDRELTVEGGRPETLTREKLEVLKAHQVTRLSINPQTMQAVTLERIGRKHSCEDIITAYHLAREFGFPVINMDLIIGLPGEKRVDLDKTLNEILALRPENITVHALALKRAAYYRQEKIDLVLPAEGQAMLDLAHTKLAKAGYLPYYLYRQKEIFAHGENVGYSLPGKICFYNLLMMEERQTILGCGVGASSKFVDLETNFLESIYNPKDILFYLQRVDELLQRKVDNLQTVL